MVKSAWTLQEQELIAAGAATEAASATDRLDNLSADDVAFTPAGGLASTTVQDALEEVVGAIAPAYTDEQAQDAVGGILTDSDTIDFTYNDGTPSVTAAVKDNVKLNIGFPCDAVTGYQVSLSYDDSTRVVTITPTGATFDVYVGGKKYTKTGPQASTAHADVTDEYFIYYDSTGTLQTSTTPWDLRIHAPVCSVTYNATTKIAPFPLFELHTAGRDPELHYRLHFGGGTVRGTKLGTPTFTGTGTPQFTATAVQVLDEDIELDTSAFGSSSNRVVYLLGANAEWTEQTDNFAAGTYSGQGIKFLNDGTDICYNQLVLGSWAKTAVSNNYFVNMYLFATTHITQSKRYWVMPGQAQFSTLNAAQNEALSSLTFPNIAPEEYVAIARITFSRKTSNGANNLYANIEGIALLDASRTTSIGGGGISDHNLLTNLQGGTTNQYYHLTANEYQLMPQYNPAASKTVPAGYGLYIPGGRYEITTGTSLEIAATGVMEIG